MNRSYGDYAEIGIIVTFASRLNQQSISLHKISKWMGHSNITVTQIYAHFAPIYDNDIEKLTIVPTEAPVPATA